VIFGSIAGLLFATDLIWILSVVKSHSKYWNFVRSFPHGWKIMEITLVIEYPGVLIY